MMKYQIEFTDTKSGACSAIDIINAPKNYTATQYIKDCESNASVEWCEMLKGGIVTIIEINE